MMALLPLSARADFDSAVQAYQRQQYDIAYKEFSQLAAQGDNHAKSYEAMMTLRGQGTKVNVEVGAQLARECAAGGEPTCYAMFAQLNLPGHGLQVNLPQARLWTRKAIAGGDLRAGFLLWQAYQLDPANQYLVNGQVDRQRYQQLGRRSVAQRAEQSEAIDALAAAAASGYDPARLSLAALLIEKNGASSMHQVGVLLADLPDLPANFQKYRALAQQTEALGPTRASPTLIATALPAVNAALVKDASRTSKTSASACKDFRLLAISNVSTLRNATWLPLKQPLVADSYPLSGTWQEQWQVHFCGSERKLQLRFEADGMGGASYRLQP
jgi:TPR repeat protein